MRSHIRRQSTREPGAAWFIVPVSLAFVALVVIASLGFEPFASMASGMAAAPQTAALLPDVQPASASTAEPAPEYSEHIQAF